MASLISAPPKPTQPGDTPDHHGSANGNDIRRVFRAHGVALRFAAAHTLMRFAAGSQPYAEHFINMGKVFLALVCIGIVVLKLTRFRGHRNICVQGVHDGEDETTLHS